MTAGVVSQPKRKRCWDNRTPSPSSLRMVQGADVESARATSKVFLVEVKWPSLPFCTLKDGKTTWADGPAFCGERL